MPGLGIYEPAGGVRGVGQAGGKETRRCGVMKARDRERGRRSMKERRPERR